jgi:hypothetical protein
MAQRDVSWKRVGVAAIATFASLYGLGISLGLASGGVGSGPPAGSIGLTFAFILVSNAVWWGVLLYPRRTI